MMHKIITSSWDFGMEPAAMVKVARSGFGANDRHELRVKRATDRQIEDILRKCALGAGDLPIHTIAIGATEAYGSNRNGDGFCEDTCRKQASTFDSSPLRDYADDRHNGARFFMNHKNDDPLNSYGYVKAAFYNEDMRRIELLVIGNETKEAAERNGGHKMPDDLIDKLHRGEFMAGSMACFTNPDYPVLTRDRGYVRIEDITPGDLVWTHAGRWRKVTELRRRKYTGEVFDVHVNGLPLPLELTAEHPMWARVFTKNKTIASSRAFKDDVEFESVASGWTAAKELAKGDRLFVRPIDRYAGYGAIGSIDLALLLGYFVAEGSFNYNGDRACQIDFTCHASDEAVRAIPKIVERSWPDITVQINPKQNSDAALTLSVFNTELAEFTRRLAGKGCRGKFVPPEIFNADHNVKLAFLSSWLDGDGWLDKKGIHWSSCSCNLVLQGRDLLLSLGIPSSIYKINHKKSAGGRNAKGDVEYTLNVSHLDAWQFSEFSAKAAAYPSPSINPRSKPPCLRRCDDGTHAMRIKEVRPRYVTDVTVYNFEVEDDESYSAAGLVSHNCKVAYDVCSICGNKAPTRKQYCTEDSCVGEDGVHGFGCKTGLTRLLKTGRQQFVENPRAVFFDWSKVARPAERTAYGGVIDGLAKAASHGEEVVLGGAWLAEQYGVGMGPVMWQTPLSAFQQKQVKLALQLAAMENETLGPKDIATCLAFAPQVQPPLDLQSFMGEPGSAKFAGALRSLADAGVIVSPRDFCYHQEHADTVVAGLPGMFRKLAADPALHQLLNNPFSQVLEGRPTQAQKAFATKVAETRSVCCCSVEKRAQLAVLRGRDPSQLCIKSASQTTAGGDSLAQQYALYQLATLAAMPEHFQSPLTLRTVVLQNTGIA